MKPYRLIAGITLAVFGLAGCNKSPAASLEKGGPVTATGYVDLSPPTSYSPRRGVLCESYSSTPDGKPTGECFDLSGPSVALTLKHISPEAADKLQADIDAGRFPNPRRFKTGTGTVCDLDAQKCWFEREGQPDIEAPKHTLALFWDEVAE